MFGIILFLVAWSALAAYGALNLYRELHIRYVVRQAAKKAWKKKREDDDYFQF